MSITAFLPCRAGSSRVPNKNWKPFAYVKHGLIEIKLAQLLDCTSIDKIVLSSNDTVILEYADRLNETRLTVHERSAELSQNNTETHALFSHAVDLIPQGDILWTHVTSPFTTSATYSTIVQEYKKALLQGFDSLMTTTAHQGFFWYDNQTINYDRQSIKWPRTQTLKPVHEVNSCAFVSSRANYLRYEDRIGEKVKLLPISRFEGFDIDWPEDFKLAEVMLKENLVSL
ncbi:acylneuraminate cytidylyltransferase family protein [Alteromonadaceae bacterium A_SAG2]|nr:acylneuraminate cytidylyltransferase family protein [Alteromonadaceae bacterium A_SAG2]|tara:strand:+ start:28070 stop:28756 length:687 start_codon:yes stop_codon:yes gene_type:complete